MEQQLIKPLLLNIDKKVWEDFKNKTPRGKRLNDAVVELIFKDINGNEEKTEDRRIEDQIDYYFANMQKR